VLTGLAGRAGGWQLGEVPAVDFEPPGGVPRDGRRRPLVVRPWCAAWIPPHPTLPFSPTPSPHSHSHSPHPLSRDSAPCPHSSSPIRFQASATLRPLPRCCSAAKGSEHHRPSPYSCSSPCCCCCRPVSRVRQRWCVVYRGCGGRECCCCGCRGCSRCGELQGVYSPLARVEVSSWWSMRRTWPLGGSRLSPPPPSPSPSSLSLPPSPPPPLHCSPATEAWATASARGPLNPSPRGALHSRGPQLPTS